MCLFTHYVIMRAKNEGNGENISPRFLMEHDCSDNAMSFSEQPQEPTFS